MNKKVLFIDNAVSYRNGHHLLREEGYHVDVVADRGIQDRLDIEDYDIIILQEDPETDKWSLCEKVRRLCRQPLIVISLNASADTCVRAIEAGADYFMRQPFGRREFTARVHSLLQRTRSKPAAAVSS